MIEITNKNKSDASFEQFDILFVVFLSPIICNLKFHVVVGWKMQKQVIDGRQEKYKKINHGKLTEGTRNGRR